MKLEITRLDGGTVEFRLGKYVAYGTYDSPDVYSVDHAPNQADFDAVAFALDNNPRGQEEKMSYYRDRDRDYDYDDDRDYDDEMDDADAVDTCRYCGELVMHDDLCNNGGCCNDCYEGR